MIKVKRKPLEQDLENRLNARIAELQRCLDMGQEPAPSVLDSYRYAPLKQHLITEANGKCIYCESKVTHLYYGDIEHIKPKAVFPRERLNFENLALACALCNNAKSDYWDDTYPLLNPYVDSPSDEVIALGYLVARKPGKDRARITIEKLGLNRQALLERRRERIELIQPLADQYAAAPEGALKNLLRTELLRQAGVDSEYAMIVKAYLHAACDIADL
jgi:5-methylcytosine-specific restriction endonuclease McrA